MIHGEAVQVAVFEAPGQTRVGRFGWKDQHGSLLSFVSDAYLNEMGITSRLRPKDATTVCKTTTDPEDQPDKLGLADIDHFAQFVRGTQAPPRDAALAATPDAMAGQHIFEQIGCSTCHVESMQTLACWKGRWSMAGCSRFPMLWEIRSFTPLGIFCCMMWGPGMALCKAGRRTRPISCAPARSGDCGTKSRHMHDLKSLSLGGGAIRRHDVEAEQSSRGIRHNSDD